VEPDLLDWTVPHHGDDEMSVQTSASAIVKAG